MDLSIHPGDDFYNYAGGPLLKNNPVPAKETNWGSFNQLRDFNINAVKKVLENAVADKTAPAGSLTKRVADFYTELEKKIAAAQMTRVEMRDAYKTYNKFLVADLSKTTPNLHWQQILTQLKVNGEDSILVNNPSFLKSVDSLLVTVSLQDWKTYLQWNVLKGLQLI